MNPAACIHVQLTCVAPYLLWCAGDGGGGGGGGDGGGGGIIVKLNDFMLMHKIVGDIKHDLVYGKS